MSDLSVVIPMYNEADRIEIGVKVMLDYLSSKYAGAEVFLVDDGSRDETKAKAEELARCYSNLTVEVVSYQPNRGKGAAVREGMTRATGKVRMYADADNATPIEELANLLPLVAAETSVVMASRAIDREKVEHRQPWWREWMGRCFNVFLRVLSGIPYRDTQCGFKLFGAKAADVCFSKQRVDGFAFDVELVMIAMREKFPIQEVPVRWRHVEESRVSPITDAARMACDALRIRVSNEWN